MGTQRRLKYLMRFFNNIVFWKKLVMIGLIPLLVISMVIGVLSYNRASLAAQESGKNNIIDAINRIDITITLRTRQLTNTINAIANHLELSSSIMDEQGWAALLNTCVNITEPFPEIVSLSIFQGKESIFSTLGPITLTEDRAQALYQQMEGHGDKTILTKVSEGIRPQTDSQGEQMILAIRGIKDSSGRLANLLVLEINANTFGSILLNKQKINPHQINFLVEGGQNIVYCENALPQGLLEEALAQYHQGRRTFTFPLDGKTYFCCTQYNGMLGWITFICIEGNALFPGAVTLRNYIAFLVTVCVMVACLLLMVLSQLITRPLETLNTAMKQVQKADFDIHLENNRTDEIGDLTDSFNYMVDQIRTLVNRVYREQLAQKNAEMEALQAQINPHFLYNSLDSINWMLIDRGEMDISHVVVALGKLMQYSMDSRTSLVPIREEYRNAKDYLIIQRNRLEDQLEYHLELEEGLEEFCIPKLILQPLIENAIKHGVLASMHRCRVVVETCRVDSHICIRVSDNGAGMTEEKREACQELLNGNFKDRENIGIRNVARRLQLHFDGQCEFQITSKPGEGTCISLKLPIITNRGDRFEDYHY